MPWDSSAWDQGFWDSDLLSNPNPQPQKTKRMRRQAYYPTKIAEQILWLTNFFQKLPAYAATLGAAPAQQASIIADCRWLIYVLGSWLPAVRAFAPACTDAATAAQTGPGTSLSALTTFTAPPLPAAGNGLPAVVPVFTGALDRIFAFVQTIKDSAAMTEAIATDLGVIGSTTGTPAPATLQPVIKAIVNGNQVDLPWGWNGQRDHVDLLQIQVDRHDGKGFVDLVHDTTPNYTDTTPFPAVLTKWDYRAIWNVDGAPIGQWSAMVSVAVGG